MTGWRISSHRCGANAGCVEVQATRAHVGIRDSTLGSASPVLVVDSGQWRAFMNKVKTS